MSAAWLRAAAPLALCVLSAWLSPHAAASAIGDDIDGLQLWLDANDLDGDGEPFANPMNVRPNFLESANWGDLSSNDLPVSAFGVSVPQAVSVDMNLANAVLFASGADQQLRTDSALATGAAMHVTVFLVYEHLSTSPTPDDVLFDLNAGAPASEDLTFSVNSAGGVVFKVGNTQFSDPTANAIEVGERHVWTLTWAAGGQGVIRRSGEQLVSASAGSAPTFSGPTYVGAGASAAAGSGVHGRLNELAVFVSAAAVSDAQREVVENALAAKWGIALDGGTVFDDARAFSRDIGGAGRGADGRAFNIGTAGGMRIDASAVSGEYLLLAGHDAGAVLAQNMGARGRLAGRAWYSIFQATMGTAPSGNVTLRFDLSAAGIDPSLQTAAGWGLAVASAGSPVDQADALANLPFSAATTSAPDFFYSFAGYVTVGASTMVEFTVPLAALDNTVLTLYQPASVVLVLPVQVVEPSVTSVLVCAPVTIQALVLPTVGSVVTVSFALDTVLSTVSQAETDVQGGDFTFPVPSGDASAVDGTSFSVCRDSVYEPQEQVVWNVSVSSMEGFPILLRDQLGDLANGQTSASFSLAVIDNALPPVIVLDAFIGSPGGPLPISFGENEELTLRVRVLDRGSFGSGTDAPLALSMPLDAELVVTEASVPFCLDEGSNCITSRGSYNFRTATVTVMPGDLDVEVPLQAGTDRVAGPGGAITVRINALGGDAVTLAGSRAPTIADSRREIQVGVEDDDRATVDVFFPVERALQVAWDEQQRALIRGDPVIVPLAIQEGSDVVEISVQLRNIPSSNGAIVVSYAAENVAGRGVITLGDSPSGAIPGAPRLRFTRSNWNRGQSVYFTPNEDNYPGDLDVSLMFSVDAALTVDPVYQDVADVVSVAMRVDGNEGAELLVSANPVPVEEGGDTEFSVRLAAQPSGSVIYLLEPGGPQAVSWRPGVLFDVIGDDGGVLSEDSSEVETLIFSQLNWNTSRTFSVDSLVDDAITGNTRTGDSAGTFGVVFTALPTVSAGLDAAFSASSVTVVIQSVDNDLPGIIVIPENVSVDEDGGSVDVRVRLRNQPDGPTFVELDNAAMLAGDLAFSPSPVRLAFPASGSLWQTGSILTLTAVDDSVAEIADTTVILTVSADTQSNYRGVADTNLLVSVVDDEPANILASTYVTTVAEGSSTVVGVRLSSLLPASSTVLVSVTVMGASSGVVVSAEPTTMHFDANNFSMPQDVVLTVEDNEAIGNSSATIVFQAIPMAGDPRNAYAQASTRVFLAVVDDERAAIDVAGAELNDDGERHLVLDEGGSSGALTFGLAAIPQSTVTLTLSAGANYLSFGTTAADGSTQNLMPGDALELALVDKSTRTVYVAVADDNVFSGVRDSVITVGVSAGGMYFSEITVENIAVRVNDDDVPEVALCVGIANSGCMLSGQVPEDADGDIFLEVALSLTSPDMSPDVQIPVVIVPSPDDQATMSTSPCGETPLAMGNCDYVIERLAVNLSQASRLIRIPIEIQDDPIYEQDEQFILSIDNVGNGAGVAVGASSVLVTLGESRPQPSVGLRLASDIIPERIVVGGDLNATILIMELSGATLGDVAATVSVTPGSFTLASGLVATSAEADDYLVDTLENIASFVLTVRGGRLDASAQIAAVQDEDGPPPENEGLIFSVARFVSLPGQVATLDPLAAASSARLTIIEDVASPTLPDDNAIQMLDVARLDARLRWMVASDDGDIVNYCVLISRRPVLLSNANDVAAAMMAGAGEFAISPVHGILGASTAGGGAASHCNLFSRVTEGLVKYTDVTAAVTSTVTIDTVTANITGLLPAHRYYALVAAVDLLGKVTFYQLETVLLQTLPSVDSDNDGLADSLEGAADMGLADDDGDGIYNDVERYLLSLPGNAGVASVDYATDGNRNGVPDVAEVAVGLLADMVTAEDTLGAQRVSLTLGATVAVASVGLHTPVVQTVVVDDDDDPLPTLSVWMRRGDYCGGDILPADYARRCAPAPTNQSQHVLLRSGSHQIWWIAVDSAGNWPLGGAVAQTIHVLPQVNFMPLPPIPVSRSYDLTIQLNGPLAESLAGNDALMLRFLSVQDFGAFQPERTQDEIDALPRLALVPGTRRGGTVVARRAAAGETREVYRLFIEDPLFVQDSSQVRPLTERVAAGSRLDAIVASAADNIPPRVRLRVRQGAMPTTTIVSDLSAAQPFVEIVDPNATLSLGSGTSVDYDWQFTDARSVPPTEPERRWPIENFADLEQGSLVIGVSGNNGRASVAVIVPFHVLKGPINFPAGADGDVDLDGKLNEGLHDTDQDGVPDFLDALDQDAYLLPMCYVTRAEGACPDSPLDGARPIAEGYLDIDRYAVSTHAWLRLRLGVTALSASMVDGGGVPSGYVPVVTLMDVQSYGRRGVTGSLAGRPASEPHGIFDVLVMDLPSPGDHASIVLPMLMPLPPQPVFVHYRPDGGWSRFVSAGRDDAVSLAGAPGFCPDVDAADWEQAQGLREGHRCVRLTIQDGGLNDGDIGLGVPAQGVQGDSMPNAVVGYLGGVDSIPDSVVVVGGSGGGGGCAVSGLRAGGLDALLAILLGWALLFCHVRRRSPAKSRAHA